MIGIAAPRLVRLLLVLMVFLPVACEQPSPGLLRICTNQWPGYEPLYLARALGHYDVKTIQLVEYASATDCMRAVGNGSLEAAALTLDEVLQLAEEGVPLKVLLVMDYSWGADALIAHPGQGPLTALKGKRIGVETSAVGSYMLHKSLQRAGLSKKDVEIIPLAVNEHLRAYKENRVDAVITFEPIRAQLLKLGAKELFSSRDIPGEILDVLVVRRDVLPSLQVQIARVINGWYKALAYLAKEPSPAAEIMAPRVALSAQEFLATLERLHLPSRTENGQLLSGENPALGALIRELAATMTEAGLLHQGVSPENVL